ncbi:MAG: HlyD family efflux transporter periplasmic adaptor subunit [Planctomycetaceae bacterium]|nr:MAG: HlyD family efflux transporter periplasmic adaptor subunit [Planctomycetaceae bacterium]
MKKFAIVLTLLAALGGAIYWLWSHEDELPEGLIQASGRIEGDQITIAADVSGRIVEMKVREGDLVEADQVLARLDDRAVRARVVQAEKALAAADATVRRAEAEHAVGHAKLDAGEKSLEVLRQEVPLQVEMADAELEHARAEYTTAEAAEQKSRRDYERIANLHQRDAVTDEQRDEAELAWIESRNGVLTARAAVSSAEQHVAEARLGPDRIVAREADVQRLRAEVSRAEATVEESRARRAEAEAMLDEARSVLEDLTVVAPVDGTIVTRIAEPGEVIVAGTPLYDLVDLDRLYLRAYIPQQHVGKLFLGAPARVYTDAFPDEPYPATVGHIASRAEFTPREVQTFEQRVKMVFAVKLYVEDNPEHRLRPGLPADAVLRWKENVEWRAPRW